MRRKQARQVRPAHFLLTPQARAKPSKIPQHPAESRSGHVFAGNDRHFRCIAHGSPA
jgi:hypothetical protein